MGGMTRVTRGACSRAVRRDTGRVGPGLLQPAMEAGGPVGIKCSAQAAPPAGAPASPRACSPTPA